MNTRALADGLGALEWVELRDWRLSSGRLKPRPGMVRVERADTTIRGLSLNGSSQYVEVAADARVWAAGTQFTIRAICTPSAFSGVQTLIGFKHATDVPVWLRMDGGNVKATLRDSGGAEVTLTSSTTFSAGPLGIEVIRDGDALSLYVNGTEEDTDTMSGTLSLDDPGGNLLFGATGASPGSFFGGTMDGPEVLTIASHPTTESLVRFPDPRSSVCRAWYDFDLDANDVVRDYTRFRNHGRAIASPSDAAALSHPWAPIHGITSFLTRDGETRVFLVAGKNAYVVEAD